MGHDGARAAADAAGAVRETAGRKGRAPLMRLLAGLTDHGDQVRLGDTTLSAERLLACAAAVADDVRGAKVVAVHATATAEAVVAMVGALQSGAAVVPVPPDSGPAELAHLLRDSGAELTLGAGGRPVSLARTSAS